MTALDLNPKTTTVAAATVRPGHIVMESNEHPAQVTRLAQPGGRVTIYCRFVWQATHEPDWKLGTLDPRDGVERAVH